LFIPRAETIATIIKPIVVVWAVVAGAWLIAGIRAVTTVGAVRKGVSGTGARRYVFFYWYDFLQVHVSSSSLILTTSAVSGVTLY
jgi:hypothetical protein